MTYNVIGFLDERLRKEMRLFEFGSGYSTMFYAARVGSVTSIESDRQWYLLVRDLVGREVDLRLAASIDDGSYANEILREDNLFDVVVIDGRDRVRCALNAAKRLSSSGVVVFDDSERTRYRAGILHLESLGFRSLRFPGLRPFDKSMSETTVLYRADNCLGL